MSAPIDIVVSGHLTLDLFPHMAHLPLDVLASPGQLFETGPLELSTGGAVSNVGLALHRLGVDVRLIGTVADDFVGRAVIAFLNERDPALAQHVTVQPGATSSYSVVLAPEKVDRIFLHHPGPNTTFDSGYIDFAQVARARLFYLGYPPILPRMMEDDGAELETIFRRARQSGAVTVLDTSLPDPHGAAGRVDWPNIMRRTLPYVDIFVPSIDEILYMLRRDDFEAWRGDIPGHLTAAYLAGFADELLAAGPAIAGFKLGEWGLYLQGGEAARLETLRPLPLDPAVWAKTQVWSPAFEVEVAGTTGAGDSAYAGLLAALLRGMPPAETARWACAVGGCNVEAADATSGVRTWEATQARLAAGWPAKRHVLPGHAASG